MATGPNMFAMLTTVASGPTTTPTITTIDELIAMIERIKQERVQVDQDAKRYQWLREQSGWPESVLPEGFYETIDALMAEDK